MPFLTWVQGEFVIGKSFVFTALHCLPVSQLASTLSQLQQAAHSLQAFRSSSILKLTLLFQISVSRFILHVDPAPLLRQLQQLCAWDIPTLATLAAAPPLQRCFAWVVQERLKASCASSLKWGNITTLLNTCIPHSLYFYTNVSVLMSFFGSSSLAYIRLKKELFFAMLQLLDCKSEGELWFYRWWCSKAPFGLEPFQSPEAGGGVHGTPPCLCQQRVSVDVAGLDMRLQRGGSLNHAVTWNQGTLAPRSPFLLANHLLRKVKLDSGVFSRSLKTWSFPYN